MSSNVSSYVTFWESLPPDERIIVDLLRAIVIETLPSVHREKFANGVPCFYLKKRICLIWPASVKGGGIKEGVLLGFAHANRLSDEDGYLDKGTNKQIFYKVYCSPEEIEVAAIQKLLKEAIRYDQSA